jgi:hypothetical protein
MNFNFKESPKKDESGGDHDLDKKVDTAKYQDFLFEMNDYFKPKEVLNTSVENSISFEMNTDDNQEVKFFSTVQMDDVHTLVRFKYFR